MVAEKVKTQVHDRRSRDTIAAGRYNPIEVDDPYAPGEKIVVLRQMRHDTLAYLHAHHRIDDAQYEAGRAYQRDWEAAERGARAVDPTREKVDGGLGIDPLPVKQLSARNKLVAIERVLGRRLVRIVQAILVHGATLESVAASQDRSAIELTGKMFRAGLEELAVEYGFSQKGYYRKKRVKQGDMTGGASGVAPPSP
jgi:hypothetical protein